MKELLEQSIMGVQKWVETRGYKGYDPGDGLTSYLRPFAFGNLFAERVLQQLIWKSPVNLRPFLGVKPLESTKGRGFMAWGYVLLHEVTGEASNRAKALACLEWLDQAREAGHTGHCWGNHFDFSTRSGCMRAHTPTIVWSSLIGHAFLEAYEQLGETRCLDVAESICQWILTLPREKTAEGSCLSYTKTSQNSVHNSNLLGAGLLSRTWRHRPRSEFKTVATEAVVYSCARQRPDGSWWYGEAPKYHWIDNFHTSYNLDSLKRFIECVGDESFRPHCERGYQYFKQTFFGPYGQPKYYHNRDFPVDIQCASQAIDTFCLFSDSDTEALPWAQKVARWTIQHMQAHDGHFYYRLYPLLTARTPYFHWGQATMFKAMSHLLLLLSRPAARMRKLAITPLAS